VGGRLIGAAISGKELLWRNPEFFDDLLPVKPRHTWQPLDATMGSWSNLGGAKTWPAPQGWSGPDQWPGPPDPVIDSGDWELAGEVVMVSPPDPYTGLQVTRSFTITGDTSFTQETKFANVSSRPVRWSIWEVIQLDTEPATDRWAGGQGLVEIAAGNEHPVVLADAHGTLAMERRNGWVRIPIQPVVAKRGFPDATGEVAFRGPNGAVLRWRFDVFPHATYPDGGSRVEVWMQTPLRNPLAEFGDLHPDANYTEVEILSPLTTLLPGDTCTQRISWELTAQP
jgi:hypothetical protein